MEVKSKMAGEKIRCVECDRLVRVPDDDDDDEPPRRRKIAKDAGLSPAEWALFDDHLFVLMGQGSVVTFDVVKLHDLSQPRISFLIGSSISPATVDAVSAKVVSANGPVLVTLDSDHSEKHVRQELACYAPLV